MPCIFCFTLKVCQDKETSRMFLYPPTEQPAVWPWRIGSAYGTIALEMWRRIFVCAVFLSAQCRPSEEVSQCRLPSYHLRTTHRPSPTLLRPFLISTMSL